MKYFTLLLLFLTASTASGQKRQLTHNDYALWNSISSGPASNDGNWLAYYRKYTTADTLFLQDRQGTKKFSFPSAFQVQFTDDGRFAAIRKKDSVHLLELKTGKSHRYPVQGQHLLSAGGRYLVLQDASKRQLRIVNLKNYAESCLDSISDLVADPLNRSAVVVHQENGRERMERISFDASIKKELIIEGAAGSFQNFCWNSKGSHLAFLEIGGGKSGKDALLLASVSGRSTSLKRLTAESKSFPIGSRIANSTLHVSDDGKRVFFDLIPSAQEMVRPESQLVIWQSNSQQLAPPEKRAGSNQRQSWSVWHPSDDRIIPLETDAHPNAVLSENGQYALVFSTSDYLPRHTYGGHYADIYLLDLDMGGLQLVLKQHLLAGGQTLLSPTGKYIAYFKDGNWWTYDTRKKKHNCITGAVGGSFINAGHDKAGPAPAHPFGGWSLGDGELVLHDAFDIWIFSSDGTSSRRITDGRSRHIRHRLYDDGLLHQSLGKVAGFSSKAIDMENTVMVTTEDQHSLRKGISLWNRKKGLHQLVAADRKIYSLQKLGGSDALTYFECSFDSPPALKLAGIVEQPIVIAQANAQQSDFHWGSSQVVHYEVAGHKLKGALFYPSNFVAGRKYPMIVNIYEKLSRTVHDYVPPSGKSENGFSATDLTQQGFFVLCPDIDYTLNDAGNSALRCVTAAVEKVLEGHPIDDSRIGIMGHSFGGYQTSYIIAHSSLFKAAIAGAPITDLRSFDLSVNNEGRPNLVLVEEEQLRLTKPFYGPEMKRNSPMESIINVQTPVLLWTSDSDQVVPPEQSMAFHIGLWRLGRESTLLVYPKEGHSLLNDKNQEDLSKRVSEWFSYYLKEDKRPDWM